MLTACGGTSTQQGDSVAGEQLYNLNIEGVRENHACSDCHSLDGIIEAYAPSFMGISTRAAERVEGMTEEEYLRQSILDPQAHVVDDFSISMPPIYKYFLTEEQIDDLIAFLLTQ